MVIKQALKMHVNQLVVVLLFRTLGLNVINYYKIVFFPLIQVYISLLASSKDVKLSREHETAKNKG